MFDKLYKLLEITLNIMKKYIIYLIILFSYLFFDYLILIFKQSNFTILDTIITTFIKTIVFIIIWIIRDHKYLKEKLLDFKLNFKKYIPYTFKYYILTYIGTLIIGILISKYTGNGVNEQTLESMMKEYPILVTIMCTLCAPFCEEMLFRREIQKLTKNKYTYYILNFILFGIVHVSTVTNPLEYLLILQYGLFGLGFSKIVNDTDNIFNTVFIHTFHNLVTVLLLLVSGGLL